MPDHSGDWRQGTSIGSDDLVEAVQLHSTVGRGVLEISRRSTTSLKITKKVYRDGPAGPAIELETERLDLTRDAVLLLYTISSPTDVETGWNIRVVISKWDSTEYHLQSEEDAFTFQRLITGYSPYGRFNNVFASALELHTFTRSTLIQQTGELQLWWFQSPESGDKWSPLGPAQTERNRSGWFRRERVVAMAKPPPALPVLFGEEAGFKNGNKLYHMWRVDSKLFPVPDNCNYLNKAFANSRSY